jgi:hypothetical protein
MSCAVSADLAIVIPLFKRTKNIARVYGSAMKATPEARVLFVASEHDHEVRDALESFCLEHEIIPGTGGEGGDYARKINCGYRATTQPLIFTGADDLVFHDGWYEAARALISMGTESTQVLTGGATLTGPFELLHNHVGVVGTRDLCNGRTMDGSHSTHSLVARWYARQGGAIDESDCIYHEGYAHEYCDDELVAVAKKRESYAHSFGPPVEHIHMLRDPSLDDEVYQHGRSRTRLSRRTFIMRSRFWGGEAWR